MEHMNFAFSEVGCVWIPEKAVFRVSFTYVPKYPHLKAEVFIEEFAFPDFIDFAENLTSPLEISGFAIELGQQGISTLKDYLRAMYDSHVWIFLAITEGRPYLEDYFLSNDLVPCESCTLRHGYGFPPDMIKKYDNNAMLCPICQLKKDNEKSGLPPDQISRQYNNNESIRSAVIWLTYLALGD
jgi:hypothetical protein